MPALLPYCRAKHVRMVQKGHTNTRNRFDDLGYSPYYIDSTETETDSELSEFRGIYGVDTVPRLLRFDRSGHHTVVEINYQADDLRAEIETAIESIGGIESVR